MRIYLINLIVITINTKRKTKVIRNRVILIILALKMAKGNSKIYNGRGNNIYFLGVTGK